MRLFLLFLITTAVGCHNDNEIYTHYNNAIIANAISSKWQSPSLTKEELKALDLKLLRDAVTFNIGDRVVYLPTNQTAIVLEPFTQIQNSGRQNGLINYEKSCLNDYVSAYNCLKIGEDYVEPPPKGALFWYDLKNMLPYNFKIDSCKITFTVGEVSRGDGGIK